MSTATDLLTALLGARNAPTEENAALIIAVAWARVSTDMQEERGLSLPEQLREIRRYAERQGITITAEFTEAASAFQREAKRVEFHRMLAYIKEHKGINAIIVHDYSRFSRDSIRGKALVRQLKESGIEVISLNDPTFDTETACTIAHWDNLWLVVCEGDLAEHKLSIGSRVLRFARTIHSS